jgi:hypothetical protein
VWWGKISKSGRTGISTGDIARLTRQIHNGTETRLYLYCPDKDQPTLHSGPFTAIKSVKPPDLAHIPAYYSKLHYPIPYWFKLTDIYTLPLSCISKLRTLDGEPFDPVSSNSYPMLVKEGRSLKPLHFRDKWGQPRWKIERLDLPMTTAPIDPTLVFVLMPLSDAFTDVYELGIKRPLRDEKLTCKKADEFLHGKDIMQVVRENIQRARLIIADLTTVNPNVFYELGYAHALGKTVILITQDRKTVPFDLSGVNNIEYRNATVLSKKLPNMVRSMLAGL